MITIKRTCLLVVDVQGKLAELMFDKEKLFKNIGILVQAARLLDMPVLWCQQNPGALGPTVEQVAEHLTGLSPINKLSFSCCGNKEFVKRLHSLNCRHILICGIESHICVYQTAMDLLDMDYDVQVVADAVSSRTKENKEIALERIQWDGAAVSTAEMALFELLATAEHDKFRDVVRLVK